MKFLRCEIGYYTGIRFITDSERLRILSNEKADNRLAGSIMDAANELNYKNLEMERKINAEIQRLEDIREAPCWRYA